MPLPMPEEEAGNALALRPSGHEDARRNTPRPRVLALSIETDLAPHLAGTRGPAAATAARILAETARLLGTDSLVPVASAHIDGCLFHGDAGVLFAETLVAGGGQVAVPTTLNVGALDLIHAGRVRFAAHQQRMAERMVAAYEALGCRPTWTCAPYQAGHRPGLGEHVAWGESNAVAFANSVLGARTNRLGDFLDICCALTGFAPETGLHLDRNRIGRFVFDVTGLSARLKAEEAFYPVLGSLVGSLCGEAVPVVVGLPPGVDEDRLKAFGAAAASSGAVALFHIVGSTPEAPSLAAALGHAEPAERVVVTPALVRDARDRLTTADRAAEPDAIAIGSPHLSFEELAALERRLAGRRTRLPVYACTSRFVWQVLQEEGRAEALEAAGVVPIVDTCVVVAPILPEATFDRPKVLMTNSGKFAHYAPGNTGWATVYGSLDDCVETAVAGRLVRDEGAWA
ncbi:aconitase X [Prosthecodimorpha hirschii]|uniref:aconitase X n=1 Tax=Prosthecodimorpha hirschii TaxID=665126 RepID=UPI001FEE1B71|nr:aconitase X catalytic domain-containing protein [Prosthecomicrobium hirschii]